MKNQQLEGIQMYGVRIHRAMTNASKSFDDVVASSGLASNRLSRLLKGEGKSCTVDDISKICTACGILLVDFFDDVDQKDIDSWKVFLSKNQE